MNTRWLKSVLIIAAFAVSLPAQSRQNLLDTVHTAPELQGWVSKSATDYDSTHIEDFGGNTASILRLYGAKGVTSTEWAGPQGSVRATLFEMIDSPAAYGFFTFQRAETSKPTPILIGGDSFRNAGTLYFWQSKYVIRLDGPAAAEDLIARLLSGKILGSSQKPTVAEHLPASLLIPGSEKYVLNADAIDPAVGINTNLLGFDASAEAATARYRNNAGGGNLLLLMFPTQHLAKKYADQIQATPTPPQFLKRDGPLLGIVYGTSDSKMASAILDSVSHEYNVTYNESNVVASYAKMILTIFKLIGIALLLSVGAGIAFGGLRLFVKKWFPNRVFDRAQDIEIIQLRLDQSLTRKELSE